jgi:hypothetical protein
VEHGEGEARGGEGSRGRNMMCMLDSSAAPEPVSARGNVGSTPTESNN